jgi:hypothetical protein
MTFKKNHKKGAKKLIYRPLDKDPISFKGFEGSKERLKSVPGWQGILRDVVERLISDTTQNGRAV